MGTTKIFDLQARILCSGASQNLRWPSCSVNPYIMKVHTQVFIVMIWLIYVDFFFFPPVREILQDLWYINVWYINKIFLSCSQGFNSSIKNIILHFSFPLLKPNPSGAHGVWLPEHVEALYRKKNDILCSLHVLSFSYLLLLPSSLISS